MQIDVVTGDQMVFAFIDLVAKQLLEDPLIVDICSLPGVTCPIKAGTVFSTTQKYTAPSQLPDSYAIGVGIGSGQPEFVPLGCAIAFVGGNDLSAVSSADLEVWNFL
ncbi:unnamed protein product [Rhizophagus irregularis]|nr:unnamed protein product [Rhizophagus irregularis]